MRILLTGGAGFIGSHVAEALLRLGHELTIFDNFNDFYSPRIKEANVEEIRRIGDFDLRRADLLDLKALQETFRQRSPEVIVHLAAYAGVRPSLERPALYDHVNVTGTIHLLELARASGTGHFIFGSTSSVYGINTKVPFAESDPLDTPVSPYAVTKRAAELLCFTYHHNYGLPVTCLRFFTVYGPRQRPEMAIHKFTRMILEGMPIPIYHQGRSQRDYTYVDDIVQGVTAAVQHRFDFEIINLGNSKTVPLLDLVHLIEQATGRGAELRLMPAQLGDVPITYADIDKARRLLDYAPATTIETGVPRFIEWYGQHAEDL